MSPTEAKIKALLEGPASALCMDNADDRSRLIDLLMARQPWVHDVKTIYQVLADSLTAVVKARVGIGLLTVDEASTVMGVVDEMARNAAQALISS